MEHLSGVYFPYWIYDISLRGKLKAKATKTRIWRDHDTEFTETKFYEIEREGKMEFKDMTENALKKANPCPCRRNTAISYGRKQAIPYGIPFRLFSREA